MEHGIINYLIDNDDDVHMIYPEKQIHNRIRCVQYHQYQTFNFVAIHVISPSPLFCDPLARPDLPIFVYKGICYNLPNIFFSCGFTG